MLLPFGYLTFVNLHDTTCATHETTGRRQPITSLEEPSNVEITWTGISVDMLTLAQRRIVIQ